LQKRIEQGKVIPTMEQRANDVNNDNENNNDDSDPFVSFFESALGYDGSNTLSPNETSNQQKDLEMLEKEREKKNGGDNKYIYDTLLLNPLLHFKMILFFLLMKVKMRMKVKMAMKMEMEMELKMRMKVKMVMKMEMELKMKMN